MNTTTTVAKTVSFSQIFNDKKSLTIYFPSDISLTFRIVKEIHNWIPCFQTLLFVFPAFQRDFYKALIKEQQVKIVSPEDLRPLKEQDLILILSKEKKIQKLAECNGSPAMFGYGREVNVRFQPFPEDPLELCKKLMELLNIPSANSEVGVDFPPKNHEFQLDEELERKYILDLHNPYNRLRAIQKVNKITPPYEYLSIKTKYPQRHSRLIRVSSDPQSPKQYPFKVNLYEIMKQCMQAKIIITDNRDFYELLTNFFKRDRIMFCENLLTTRKFIELIK